MQSPNAPFSSKGSGQLSVQRRHTHLTIVFVKPKGAVGRLAEARRFFYDCCKNRLKITWTTANKLQQVRRCRLLFQRLVPFVNKLLNVSYLVPS